MSMKPTVDDFWPGKRDYIKECLKRNKREKLSKAWYAKLTIEPVHALWLIVTHEVDDRGLPFHGTYLLDAKNPRDALLVFAERKEEGTYQNVSIRPFHGEIFNGS